MLKSDVTDNDAQKKMEKDSASDSYFISYNLIPSLESISIVTISTTLWSQPDVRDAMEQHSHKFSYRDEDESEQEIFEKILKKVSAIPLPNVLKTKVINVIRPLGKEIFRWINLSRENFHFYNFLANMDSIQWTLNGTIDDRKTLDVALGNREENDICEMFNVACDYCLQGHIFDLWENIPEEVKTVAYGTDVIKDYHLHLVAFWTSIIKNEQSEFLNLFKALFHTHEVNNINVIMFASSVFNSNTSAFIHFYHQFTPEEIGKNLIKWTERLIPLLIEKENEYQTTNVQMDMLCFLLSEMMDEEQQRYIFQKYTDVILRRLLFTWPWQKYLVSMICVMWDYLTRKTYIELLSTIAGKIKIGSTEELIFKELWLRSPVAFQNYFIQELALTFNGACVLWHLVKIEDMGIIKLILQGATAEVKKQIIFALNQSAFDMYPLFYDDKVSFLDLLIQETLLLKCDIDHFKEDVTLLIGNKLFNEWICKNNWQAVEKFLSWAFTSQAAIDDFLLNKLNKKEVTQHLIFNGNYESLDKFMNRCFGSQEEIDYFKNMLSKDFTFCYHILKSMGTDTKEWNLFKMFIGWCFDCDLDIENFKQKMLKFEFSELIFNILASNMKFANELLVWTFNSKEEILEFKKRLLLSRYKTDIYEEFIINCYKDNKSWKSVRKLSEWFYSA